MSLSVKQLDDNPWETLDQKFKVGDKIKGKISNITDFGIFVQLLPGIDGLVHISDLSWTEHIDHPSDRYKPSAEVEAVILSLDKENKKISLGIKQLSRDPWESVATDFPVDSIIDGEISKITNFGAFVKLATGIEGLVHNTTLMDDQGKKAEEVLKVGQAGKFRVLNVNKEERKLGLSMNLEKSAAESKPARPQQQEKAPRQAKPKQEEAPTNASTAPKVKSSLQTALEAMQENKDKDKESK